MLTIGILCAFATFVFISRHIAYSHIEDYMTQQGVKDSDISLKIFRKDWNFGGYHLFLTTKKEPSYYYEYSYFIGKGKKYVTLQVYETSAETIQSKVFGGNGLTSKQMEKVLYPPLKNFTP